MKKRITLVLMAFLLTTPLVLDAHSGRTDSNGGHYNRSTGQYHYHNGGGARTTSTSSYSQPADVVSIYKVQVRLNELGYPCGTPDGVKGPQTTRAIKNFQSAKGLEADGVVGNQTKQALGL